MLDVLRIPAEHALFQSRPRTKTSPETSCDQVLVHAAAAGHTRPMKEHFHVDRCWILPKIALGTLAEHLNTQYSKVTRQEQVGKKRSSWFSTRTRSNSECAKAASSSKPLYKPIPGFYNHVHCIHRGKSYYESDSNTLEKTGLRACQPISRPGRIVPLLSLVRSDVLTTHSAAESAAEQGYTCQYTLYLLENPVRYSFHSHIEHTSKYAL